jgi:hypothetical protein
MRSVYAHRAKKWLSSWVYNYLEVKNACSYIISPRYFMAWCLIKHTENITLSDTWGLRAVRLSIVFVCIVTPWGEVNMEPLLSTGTLVTTHRTTRHLNSEDHSLTVCFYEVVSYKASHALRPFLTCCASLDSSIWALWSHQRHLAVKQGVGEKCFPI